MEIIHIERDRGIEKQWLDRLFVIASFPRSGSHWTRRMMGEISVMRGHHKSAAFGGELNTVAGFNPPRCNTDWQDKWATPFFIATHHLATYPENKIRVYLRRNFEAVLRSTQKAQKELKNCWWGGTEEEVYKKWSDHVAKGCAVADVVIDYEVTRSNPATTVRTIGRIANLNLTEAEISAAVLAGDRQNMLKEQEFYGNRKWDVVNREDKSNHPPEKETIQ
jgi:hypothetical protein